MKELLEKLKAKAVEHKELLIRVGLAVGGAAIGAAITTLVVANSENGPEFWEEMEDQNDESMSITDSE